MTILIIIFGALTCLAGTVIAMSPERICGYMHRQVGKVMLQVLNVVVRVVFGVLLISLSSSSKFSFLTDTIGWFCIAIAVILSLMGRKRFDDSISWAITLVETHSRFAGFLIMTFGAFLIYAYV
ncbi:MAG: hypothetical protein GY702_10570 [Desulfobulbaceae bacterium]|nr:hypothetical protein [Desulfobulbaceae bacterium]